MQFVFTEQQELIRETAATFLAERGGPGRVRRAVESPLGYDAADWRAMVEMGWTSTALPETYGGAGLGHVELAIVQEQIGRCLHPSPFFATVCLAAPAIMQAATAEQRQALLPGIASGATRATLALTDERGVPGVEGVSLTLGQRNGSWRLEGSSCYVMYAHAVELFIVAARAKGSRKLDGVSLIALPASTSGIVVEPLTMMDATRPMSRARFIDVAVSSEQILGEPQQAGAALEKALHHAAIALAAEQTGAAHAALDITTQYVKQRVQFGRPVGSFQAVKHRLADLFVRIEAARSAVYYAACIADEDSAELAEAAAIAKAYCSDVFTDCAAEMVQLHGGIGFTWEHEAQLYFKRARATANLLGSPRHHRECLAVLMGLGPPGAWNL